ncbi:transcriptional regulator [Rhodobacter calidifons]|uniref:Transcriptional regulator n=1 Tax=Rhodobacter calidifons TaxID=2715277 RepID=A0ABX0G4R5_9RHOB|nr:transcriptional regulator [Rhodobacter calidifons]NHB76194.1 transcriptional regulator [Rhodobacter calidifons]
MARKRIIPDATVFGIIQRLLEEGGDKAVSFSSVATATGLAPPTLVQRYGSRDAMVRAARLAFWDALDQRTGEAVAATAGKGPQGLLKAIGPVKVTEIAADLRDPDLAQRASAWRAGVEAALAERLGSGTKARESAALLFAAWQGLALWSAAGPTELRLKDAVKRLT